jgi:hypothetical protein
VVKDQAIESGWSGERFVAAMMSQTSKYCESWTAVFSLAIERIQQPSVISFATL